MDNRALHDIATSLNNVAAAIRERLRHQGQNSKPPFEGLQHAVDLEVLRLSHEGHDDLARGLAALRDA